MALLRQSVRASLPAGRDREAPVPAEWEVRLADHETRLLAEAIPFGAGIFLALVLIGFARHLVEVHGGAPLRPGTHLAASVILVSVLVIGRRFPGRIRPELLLGIMSSGVLLILTIVAYRLGAAPSNAWFGYFLFVMTLGLCCPLSVSQVLAVLVACWGGFGVVLSGSGSISFAAAGHQATRLFMGSVLAVAATTVTARLRREQFLATLALEEEQEKTRSLLLNVLPPAIADRMQSGEITIADGFEEVTVLFADIVGFTRLSAERSPEDLVEMLDRLFTAFDGIALGHGLEKIKTIGDCYMVAAGIPEPRDDHARATARFALDMLAAVEEFNRENETELAVRVGIHTGPVVAGVIGQSKFTYDLWGDTVNTASRMESHGEAGRVHLSRETAERLEGDFELESRGRIPVKGKGELETSFLVAARPASGD